MWYIFIKRIFFLYDRVLRVHAKWRPVESRNVSAWHANLNLQQLAFLHYVFIEYKYHKGRTTCAVVQLSFDVDIFPFGLNVELPPSSGKRIRNVIHYYATQNTCKFHRMFNVILLAPQPFEMYFLEYFPNVYYTRTC